ELGGGGLAALPRVERVHHHRRPPGGQLADEHLTDAVPGSGDERDLPLERPGRRADAFRESRHQGAQRARSRRRRHGYAERPRGAAQDLGTGAEADPEVVFEVGIEAEDPPRMSRDFGDRGQDRFRRAAVPRDHVEREIPPSTTRVAPTIWLAASESRKATALAMPDSSGRRPPGERLSQPARWRSESGSRSKRSRRRPEQTALTWMFFGPSSTAR